MYLLVRDLPMTCRDRMAEEMRLVRSTLKGALAAPALMLCGQHAGATMPPDPNRPVVANTCREAIRVLREAIAGHPGATAEQISRRVQLALALVEAHCVDKPAPQKKPPKP